MGGRSEWSRAPITLIGPPLPALHCANGELHNFRGGGSGRSRVHRLLHQLQALFPIFERYSLSTVPQIKSAFFLSTNSAVVSANARSLRRRSRSSSLLRDLRSLTSARSA